MVFPVIKRTEGQYLSNATLLRVLVPDRAFPLTVKSEHYLNAFSTAYDQSVTFPYHVETTQPVQLRTRAFNERLAAAYTSSLSLTAGCGLVCLGEAVYYFGSSAVLSACSSRVFNSDSRMAGSRNKLP